MISLQDLKKRINKKLEVGALPAKVLQSKFKVGFPLAVHSDPTFMPFYYHLGRILKGAKNLIELGFDLGMPSGCFIDGCGSVDKFLAFKKKTDQYYPKRLGVSNIHTILRKKFDLWVGEESDPEFIKMVLLDKWDCAIICDSGHEEKTYRAYLDLVWNQMMYGGLVVVDLLGYKPVKAAYESFCKVQGREPFLINTLRGTGIIQK
jgi:hypothetical protein